MSAAAPLDLALVASEPPAPPGGPPPPGGAPPGAAPFHGALQDEMARTAKAEGQSQEEAEAPRRKASRPQADAETPAASGTGQPEAILVPGAPVLAVGSRAVPTADHAPTASASAALSVPAGRRTGAASTQATGKLPVGASSTATVASSSSQAPQPGTRTVLQRAAAAATSAPPSPSATVASARSTQPTVATVKPAGSGEAAVSELAERASDLPRATGDARPAQDTPAGAAATSRTDATSVAGPPAGTRPGAIGEAPLAPAAGPVAYRHRQDAPPAAGRPTRATSDRVESGGSDHDTVAGQREADHAAKAPPPKVASRGLRAAQKSSGRRVVTASRSAAVGGRSAPDGAGRSDTTTTAAAVEQTGSAPDAPSTPGAVGHAQTAQIVESIQAAVAFARRGGAAVARIALHPRELGDVRVHLSQSSQGLVARLTASTPAGTQALVQARAELHRSLSELGTTLLRLDVGANDQPQQRPTAGEGPGAGAAGEQRGEAAASEESGEGADASTPGPTAQAKGVHLDVLA